MSCACLPDILDSAIVHSVVQGTGYCTNVHLYRHEGVIPPSGISFHDVMQPYGTLYRYEMLNVDHFISRLSTHILY